MEEEERAPSMVVVGDEDEEEEEEEAVLVDVRLEFWELIHMRGPCFEVMCVEDSAHGVYVGEHGGFFAIAMPPLRLPSAPIPRSSSAASNLPPLTVRAPKPLPSEPCLGEALRAAPRLVDDAFWLGLRYAADWEVRPHLRFALFAQGYLRLFVLPRPDERCVRCVVLTRRAAMAADVERRLAEAEMQQSEEAEEEEDALLALHEDPPFLGLLRACVMGPTAGSDWPASGAVAVEEERDGSGGFRLHRHQHASLAWMRAVEVEAGTTAVPLAAACPPLTVGGDDGLFSVDCHGAVWTRGAARHREEKQQAGKGDAVIDLPRGGLLAHPVGAGKTVIAASLLLPFPSSKLSEAATLILAPDHILFQWRRELARVLSDEGPSPRFVLVGFEELLLQQQAPLSLTEEAAGDGMEAIRARRWGRLVVDEGQLVPQDEALYEAVLGIQADVRWVLSATPDHGLRWLMSLVYGRELSHDDFRRRRRAFVHTRTLRDAPGDCLPLPPLTSEMEAVTLSAEESQALALASALGESLERTVALALCPEWAVPPPEEAEEESFDDDEEEEGQEDADHTEERFASFDAWYVRATAAHAQRLAEARARVEAAVAAVAAQEERHAAGLAAGRDAEPLESLTLVFEEGSEPPPAVVYVGLQQQQQQQQQRRLVPWAGGVYHHISAHGEGGRPLYRYRSGGRYLAWVDGRWGVFEGDPTLDASAGAAPTPAFVSLTGGDGGDEDAALRPDGVKAWYRRPGLVASEAEEAEEVEEGMAAGVLKEEGGGRRLYRAACTAAAASGAGPPYAVRYRGAWWLRMAGLRAEEEVMDRVEGVGEMADDERGVDDSLWAALDVAESLATELAKAAAYCEGLRATMADGRTECAVCLAPLRGRNVTVLSCLHAFDDRCVRTLASMTLASSAPGNGGNGGATSATVACPICRRRTRRRDMSTFLHMPPLESQQMSHATTDVGGLPAATPSSKLGAVCDRLRNILGQTGGDKAVVFAKWGHALELLSGCLHERGVPSLYFVGARHDRDRQRHRWRLSGEARRGDTNWGGVGGGCVALLSPLGPEARAVSGARALAAFNGEVRQAEAEEEEEGSGDGHQPPASTAELAAVRVLLLRLDEEAAGLNLHGAQHVLLLHPYIDPSIQAAELVPLAEAQELERQAVGRCHRYPQTRPVRVYRFYARGTVEEEMYVCWGLLGEDAGDESAGEEGGEVCD